MGTIRLLVAALCIAAGAVAATASPARAATIVVNPGQSIQAAIDAANPGDTILVRPGTYREELVIQKDGIKLLGSLATIQPPSTSTSPCGAVAICVLGNVDSETGVIFGYVHHVTVAGFIIVGHMDSIIIGHVDNVVGILAYAADGSTFTNNQSLLNEEYGIAAFSSTGTTVAGNLTRGNGEAGIYVGDSPAANASVHDNGSRDNAFGLLVRDAGAVTIQHNTLNANCAGMVVLADEPGPADNVAIRSNTVSGNTESCPSSDLGPVSGVGIVLAGADHVLVHGNDVESNTPSGFTAFQGGVVVESGPGGTPAGFDTVAGNTILHNSPDIFWDQLGHGNVFRFNTCHSSIPHGLCS